ncbi:HlyD family secretion protein [Acinetobacter zhairhuonensis]|uniref:HlyD family secretion protein n=1 Tax=Acinetobacter sp. A7.4 TaxID=2919921 RepID=UPI001F4F4A4F|nr:efflux RND transporter periplasmic adaptor subunit [Acinetobacter sp. A7.4]MCJ8162036.1 efflux RND transporter periplasmic adaptor subunit [Acinetobacter sp. A7.4]
MTQDQTPPDQEPKVSSLEEQHAEQLTSETENKTSSEADSSESVNTSQPSKAETSKPKIVKMLVTILIILLLGVIAFGLWKSYQPKMVEIQGRVEAETIHISSKIPSRIEELYVHDGQKVKKGQPLIRLYSPEIDAKKQQTLAGLQSALALQSTADRGSQQENIDTLYANWQAMKSQQVLAETTYQRGAKLFQEGVISRQRRDEMQAAAQSATQLTEAAYQQYARSKRGSTTEQKSTADAQVEIAKAAVAEANALDAETKLFSPVDGTISKTYGKVSELVAMGVPVMSIILDDEMWVSLNVREDQYAQVYQAKTLEGFIPALNKTAQFKIKSIDAEGEFATIKTTRQTGGYDIRSFKLHLTPSTPIPDLKVGMSVLFKVKEQS